jgi:membrane associated rhomboid family serine protease
MHEAPVLTFVLIVVTCVFSYQGFKNWHFTQRYIFNPEAILAGKEYHRVVTSAFLHADWQHLIFNMLTLYLFGTGLEFFLGRGNYLLVYFGAIVGGSLLSLWVHRNHAYTAYGASGGVAGVIFATILLNPGGSIAPFYFPIPIPGWLYAIGYLLYSFFGMKEHRGDVGHDAHLGGAIIGFLITAALEPLAVRTHPMLFAAVLAGTVLLLVYLWYNPLFLPVSSFLDQIGRNRKSGRAAPGRKRQVPQIDAILEKIAKSGMQSLTDQEKQVLDEASGKYRRQGQSEKPKSGLAI